MMLTDTYVYEGLLKKDISGFPAWLEENVCMKY